MLCKPKKFGRFLVRAGDLKHRITLQKRELKAPTVSVDFLEVYTDIATVYAAIDTPNAKTPFSEINTTETITHLFFIRFLAGIEPKNTWILHQEQRYSIVQIVNMSGLNEWLRIDCNIKGNVQKPSSKW